MNTVNENRSYMGKIITVTGEIPADQLGVTLAHEHLWFDLTQYGTQDNIIQDASLIATELDAFKQIGGNSILEMTSVDIGRDATQLRNICIQSGIQIVSGISLYREFTYPRWVFEADIDRIADYFVDAIEEGADGVRAGFIGELASHDVLNSTIATYQLTEVETRVFQAAAQAQSRTGAAITTHACEGHGGIAQLNVLQSAGADLTKVAIGHCDGQQHTEEEDHHYCLSILQRGAYACFDLIGWTQIMPDTLRADRITRLIQLGYEEHILLSTDTCRRSQLHCKGGADLITSGSRSFRCLKPEVSQTTN